MRSVAFSAMAILAMSLGSYTGTAQTEAEQSEYTELSASEVEELYVANNCQSGETKAFIKNDGQLDLDAMLAEAKVCRAISNRLLELAKARLAQENVETEALKNIREELESAVSN